MPVQNRGNLDVDSLNGEMKMMAVETVILEMLRVQISPLKTSMRIMYNVQHCKIRLHSYLHRQKDYMSCSIAEEFSRFHVTHYLISAFCKVTITHPSNLQVFFITIVSCRLITVRPL